MFAYAEKISNCCPNCGSTGIKVVFEKKIGNQIWYLDRCRQCRLYFTNPSPTKQIIEQYYRGDYHSRFKSEGESEKFFRDKYYRYVKWLVPHLPRNARVLDIGCSTGLLVKMLCERGFRSEGIEINADVAKWGSKNYGVKIYDKPLSDCSLATGSIDAVILGDVLEHIPQPFFFLSEVKNILTSEGLALVTFPDIESLESRYNFFLAKLFRRPYLWRNCYIPYHIWEFSKGTAVSIFEKAGFRIIEFRRSHTKMKPMPFGIRKLTFLPTALFNWKPLAGRLGNQLEFLIKKQQ